MAQLEPEFVPAALSGSTLDGRDSRWKRACTIPSCRSSSLSKDWTMAKKQTKAVRKIEKAVRKAVKKGVTEGAVEKAVSQGMANGAKKKPAVSVKADLRAAKTA